MKHRLNKRPFTEPALSRKGDPSASLRMACEGLRVTDGEGWGRISEGERMKYDRREFLKIGLKGLLATGISVGAFEILKPDVLSALKKEEGLR